MNVLYGTAASGIMRAALSFGLSRIMDLKGSQVALFHTLDMTISSFVANIFARYFVDKEGDPTNSTIHMYLGGRVVGLIIAATVTVVVTEANKKLLLAVCAISIVSQFVGLVVNANKNQGDFADIRLPIV